MQGRQSRTLVRLFLVVADRSVSSGRAISSLSAEDGMAKEQIIVVTYAARLIKDYFVLEDLVCGCGGLCLHRR